MAADSNVPERMDFDALWEYSNPAGTGERFRELLPDARTRGDRAYLAQLLTQIARTEGLQQRFDAAHALLDEAEGLIDEETPVAWIRLLLERGRAFNSGGEPARAKPLFEEAYRLAVELPVDFYAVDAAHMLEIVCSGEEKLDWNARACEVAEGSASEVARKWLGSLYNNRGFSLHELERYDEALGVFRKRLAHLEAQAPRSPEQIAIARWSIAKTLRLLGRPDEALEIQESLSETSPDDGYVFEELGECLLALDRLAEARPHFARAHELLKDDPWLKRDETERLARLERLGAGETE